ncbi:mobilization protein [Agrobacterium tumefaciens]|uniref:mobilization protein n=2 Tax=Rhizobiaceae TaxID=82115 RepID=UPI0014194676|nr:mobilization protein [Agrobacterium tumefaciens]NSZ22992.1 mobilization protein [Agrobacterium tumefaciens]QQE37053.1 mobilization protein [Agrobacterium tumefaciens]
MRSLSGPTADADLAGRMETDRSAYALRQMLLLIARLAAQERQLEVRRKTLLGAWVLNELQNPADLPNTRMLQDLLRVSCRRWRLGDDDRALLGELVKGGNADEAG